MMMMMMMIAFIQRYPLLSSRLTALTYHIHRQIRIPESAESYLPMRFKYWW